MLHSILDPHAENVKVGIRNGKKPPGTQASPDPTSYHHNFSKKQSLGG